MVWYPSACILAALFLFRIIIKTKIAKLTGVRPPLGRKKLNIALLANTHNGIYEELRSEEKNPEARMMIGEKKFQNG